MTAWIVIGILIKIGLVVGITQGAVAYLILVERKVAAFAQDRLGPNRVGPFGLLQPLADGAKMILKEDVIPGYVSKPLYILAPVIAIIAAIDRLRRRPVRAGRAERPAWLRRADPVPDRPRRRRRDPLRLRHREPGVYGVILAGWASNNKYSFLGGLRSSAQLISYEIPLGMSILGMVLLAGSLDLNTIVNWQDRHVWGIVVQPLGFLLFLVSAFAETNRLPFDLPESEQELVGGFHTEYSAMKFGMFFLGRIPARHHRQLPDGDPLLRRLGPPLPPGPGPDGLARRPGQGAGARSSRWP